MPTLRYWLIKKDDGTVLRSLNYWDAKHLGIDVVLIDLHYEDPMDLFMKTAQNKALPWEQ